MKRRNRLKQKLKIWRVVSELFVIWSQNKINETDCMHFYSYFYFKYLQNFLIYVIKKQKSLIYEIWVQTIRDKQKHKFLIFDLSNFLLK